MDVFTACKNGDLDTVEQFLYNNRDQADMEQSSNSHVTGLCGTPLMFALRFHHLDIAELLIEYGADVNKTRDGRGSLSIAIEEGFIEAVKLLLEKNVRVSETDFMLSLTGKHWEISALLLDQNFNLEYVNSLGVSFLHVTVIENKCSLSERLMVKCPQLVQLKDGRGRSPLALAKEHDFNELSLLIKKHIALYNLDTFRTSSLTKFSECQNTLNLAEQNYNSEVAIVDELREKVNEAKVHLQRLESDLQEAHRNAERAKQLFEHEIEDIDRKISLKPSNKLFECPVCLDIPFPPKQILQCVDGHVLCSECRTKVTVCPECRCELNNLSRNRRLEGLIEQLQLNA